MAGDNSLVSDFDAVAFGASAFGCSIGFSTFGASAFSAGLAWSFASPAISISYNGACVLITIKKI